MKKTIIINNDKIHVFLFIIMLLNLESTKILPFIASSPLIFC